MKELINGKMSFGELFSRFPEKRALLAEELRQKGLHCLGCSAANFESLEEGFTAHGMQKEEIDQLIAKLNTIVSN